MQLPKGWTYYDPLVSEPNRPVKCDCCDWKGHESDLDNDIWLYDGIYQRIDRGDIMPAGFCPAEIPKSDRLCSALVYFNDVTVAFKKIPNILEQIVEATDSSD